MSCFTNGQTNGPCPNWTFNTNKRITTSGFTYDAVGNVTHDNLHRYTWDAKNRLTSIDGGTNGNLTYTAYGWRVYNTSGSVSYLLDPSGQLLGGAWPGDANNSFMYLGLDCWRATPRRRTSPTSTCWGRKPT